MLRFGCYETGSWVAKFVGVALIVFVLFFSPSPFVQAENDHDVVEADIARGALEYALRYVDVEYETGGSAHRGVAYMWGGRMSVDDFVRAVESGAKPGIDAGVDASAVIVRSYGAMIPDIRFLASDNPDGTRIKDATSATLFQYNIQQVSPEQLRPGDLIFFKDGSDNVSGVALFEQRQGPNVYFIVASARAGKVIRTFYNVNNESWKTQFKAAGRLLIHNQ